MFTTLSQVVHSKWLFPWNQLYYQTTPVLLSDEYLHTQMIAPLGQVIHSNGYFHEVSYTLKRLQLYFPMNIYWKPVICSNDQSLE